MSPDRFDVLERFAPLFEASEPSFEGFLRRRDRKRRNQRISAGVVAIAVFVAAVWIVTTGGPFDRTQTPAVTGPTVPSRSDRVGFVGLPPEGATPSIPKHGELVLSLYGRSTTEGGRTRIYVYADGRVIWDQEGDLPYGANPVTTGFLEQRLTPEGVERIRSEIISTGLFGHDLQLLSTHGVIWGDVRVREGDRLIDVSWSNPDIYPQDPGTDATPEQARALERLDALLTHPESWLPASAWENPETTAYVPSGYSVCYEPEQGVGLSRVLASLPPPAEDLLRTQGIKRGEYTNLLGTFVYWCSDLATEEARALAQILDDAGQDPHEDVFGLRYVIGQRDPDATEVSVSFGPLLPHQT